MHLQKISEVRYEQLPSLSDASCPLWLKNLKCKWFGNVTLSKSATRSRTLTIVAMLIALTSACRIDMHVQPRQNPLSRSDFFTDQRSARPIVEGTIARGQLHEDDYFYTGKIGNNPGDVMPFPVTKEVLERGQERFNIYCAPCHSRVGDGNGFVPSRGFPRKPPSFHIVRLQKAPVGYIFDVITERLRYHAGLFLADFRAGSLEHHCLRSRAATESERNQSDVPAGQKIPSEPPKFREPGSGATLPALAPEPKI